jgi:hypothetical protein
MVGFLAIFFTANYLFWALATEKMQQEHKDLYENLVQARNDISILRAKQEQLVNQVVSAPTELEKNKYIPGIDSSRSVSFITFVSGNSYAVGSLVLLESIRIVKSKVNLIVLTVDKKLINPKILNLLEIKGAIIQEIAPILVPNKVSIGLPR